MTTDDAPDPIQGLRRPRRAPQPPRIAEADRPDPAQLARLRKQAARPWAWIVRSR